MMEQQIKGYYSKKVTLVWAMDKILKLFKVFRNALDKGVNHVR